MPPKYHLRPATQADLPTMLQTFLAAFSHGPWSDTLFPPHLRTSPTDEVNWRTQTMTSALHNPSQTHTVATIDNTAVVGWARWATQRNNTTTAVAAPVPVPGLDTQAFEALGQSASVLEGMVQAALGEERWQRAVELQYLCISPDHQRNGIGRLLMQQGLDRIAEATGGTADVWLRSTAEGRMLYRAYGFQEVGEVTVFGQGQWAMVRRAAER